MTLPIVRIDSISYLHIPPILGQSDQASKIYDMLDEVLSHAKQSGPAELTREALYEIYSEHSQANWDGQDAEAVSKEVYLEAREFLRLLPTTLPVPEIVPEPTGEIAMEWYKDPGHVFVASVSGGGVITFAGLFGPRNTLHGTVAFEDSLPQIIIESVRQIFP